MLKVDSSPLCCLRKAALTKLQTLRTNRVIRYFALMDELATVCRRSFVLTMCTFLAILCGLWACSDMLFNFGHSRLSRSRASAPFPHLCPPDRRRSCPAPCSRVRLCVYAVRKIPMEWIRKLPSALAFALLFQQKKPIRTFSGRNGFFSAAFYARFHSSWIFGTSAMSCCV